jgi:hypothetical protein
VHVIGASGEICRVEFLEHFDWLTNLAQHCDWLTIWLTNFAQHCYWLTIWLTNFAQHCNWLTNFCAALQLVDKFLHSCAAL